MSKKISVDFIMSKCLADLHQHGQFTHKETPRKNAIWQKHIMSNLRRASDFKRKCKVAHELMLSGDSVRHGSRARVLQSRKMLPVL